MNKKITFLTAAAAISLFAGITHSATPNASASTKAPAVKKAAENALPALTVQDRKGKDVDLASKKGKVLVLNFWATWCPPCRKELPAFDKLSQANKDSVEFMMINLTDGKHETVKKVKQFVKEGKYRFPLYFDTKRAAGHAFGIRGIPMTIVADAEGNVVTKRVGAVEEEELQAMIDKALGK